MVWQFWSGRLPKLGRWCFVATALGALPVSCHDAERATPESEASLGSAGPTAGSDGEGQALADPTQAAVADEGTDREPSVDDAPEGSGAVGSMEVPIVAVGPLAGEAPAVQAQPSAAIAAGDEVPRAAGAAAQAQPVEPPAERLGQSPLAIDGVPPHRLDDVRAAATAYLDYLQAYGAHDESGYFGTYAPTVSCYYARQAWEGWQIAQTSRGRHFTQRGSARLESVRLTPIGLLGEGLVFVDDGLVVTSTRSSSHRKVIRMIETEAGWRIDAETDVNQRGCFLDFSSFAVPTLDEVAHAAYRPAAWREEPAACHIMTYSWTSPRFEDIEPEVRRAEVARNPPAPCTATRQTVSCDVLDPHAEGECELVFDAQGRLLTYRFTAGRGSAPSTSVWSYHR